MKRLAKVAKGTGIILAVLAAGFILAGGPGNWIVGVVLGALAFFLYVSTGITKLLVDQVDRAEKKQ